MTKLLRICSLLLLLMALSPICYAQFDYGVGDSTQDAAPAPNPWTLFHLNPSVRLKLDFRNASVDAVIDTLSTASGIAIVKDPALTGGITLLSPSPQNLNDAFAEFNAVLTLKNATMTKSGNFLLITVNQGRGGFGGGGGGGGNGFGGNGGGGGAGGTRGATQTPVLDVYPLQYVNATNLATVINNVFAQTTTGNNTAAAGLVGGGAFGGFGAAAGGGRGGRGGNGGSANSVTGDIVKASADDFSNSLIVNAPSRDQDEIANIIRQIDKPSTQPQTAEVFKLQYALATDMLPVVQNILSNTQTTGRASTPASSTANRGGGGFGGFGGFGGNNNNRGGANNNLNGSVSADTRTNSLVVTTTQTLLDQVQQVILTLDKPAEYVGSTYIYTMQNARADVVANLLNESMGNRTTNGPTGGSLTGNGISQTSTTSSSTTGAASSLTSGARGSTSQTASQTVTSNSSTPMETVGLNDDDRIVNIRNLQGEVLLVPNIDTNSIIVVSPPELWPIVQSLLKEMDQIPQQVMIDTLIVEATLDKQDQFGIEFSANANNAFGGLHGLSSFVQNLGLQTGDKQALLTSPATPEGLSYTLTAGQYSAFVQAAATDTKIDILSTPRIYTTNNATAQINISQSIPYETGSTVATDGSTTVNYDFLDVGIVLTVTPRITSSGYVTMDVSQTANELAGYSTYNAPIVNQREATTTVSVLDGRTVVLGGIIQDSVNSTVNKVPLLGDLPLLGPLFSSTNKTDDKTELLVFLTPHVVKTSDDAQALKDTTEAELGKEAHSLIPVGPPAPKGNSSAPPAPATTVTVTPNINAPDAGAASPTPPTGGSFVVPPPNSDTTPSAATAPDSTAAPTTPAAPDPNAAAPTTPAAPDPNAAAPTNDSNT